MPWRSSAVAPPSNKALEPTAAQPGELHAGAGGRRLNAKSLGFTTEVSSP